MRVALALLAGLTLALQGCDDVRVTSEPSGGGGLEASAVRGLDRRLLRRLMSAPWTTEFQGRRRIEQHWSIGPQAHDLEYLEDVAADGQGRFAISDPELISPQLAPGDAQVWAVLQESRQGFNYRYRDFHVRDELAFQRNYTVLQGPSVQVAGRACEELVIRRKQGANLVYTLAVDVETGLILRCRQEKITGELFELAEFVSIELKVADGVAWHEPPFVEEVLPPAQVDTLVGFAVKLPDDDGGTFRTLETSMVTVPDPDAPGATMRWAKATLTDGVEAVFFLHGGPSAANEDVMRVPPPIGPWNVIEGSLRGERLMALGRVSAPDLLDLMAEQL